MRPSDGYDPPPPRPGCHYSSATHPYMISLNNNKKSVNPDLADFAGKIETRQLPFFSIIRITIAISVVLALIMFLLK